MKEKFFSLLLSQYRHLLFFIGVAFPFVLLFLDACIYPGFIARYTQLRPTIIFTGFFIFHLLYRIIFRYEIPQTIFEKLYIYVVPCISMFSLFINVADNLFYPNFVFSVFHVHPTPFQPVSFLWVLLILVYFQPSIYKTKAKLAFFSTPIFLLVHLVFFKWQFDATLFWQLKKEDGLFEYTTALSFFVASLVSFFTLKKVSSLSCSKWLKGFLVLIFITMGFGFFVIAGEEISWGQRIFNIETPEYIAKNNSQQEITIHNSGRIIEFVYHAYFVLSIYSAFAWIIPAMLKRIKFFPRVLLPLLKIVTPSWYIMVYFIPTLIYTIGRFKYSYVIVGTWEETTEMFLGLGMMFYIIDTYRNIQEYCKPWLHLKKNKNKK